MADLNWDVDKLSTKTLLVPIPDANLQKHIEEKARISNELIAKGWEVMVDGVFRKYIEPTNWREACRQEEIAINSMPPIDEIIDAVQCEDHKQPENQSLL